MVEDLRAKPSGDEIDVVQGDYRDAHVGGRFTVVVLAHNGIFDPRGRSGQLEDPFGHHWSIATHVEDVAPDEMERRVSEMTPSG